MWVITHLFFPLKHSHTTCYSIRITTRVTYPIKIIVAANICQRAVVDRIRPTVIISRLDTHDCTRKQNSYLPRKALS